MNETDMEIARGWDESGFLEFGRIEASDPFFHLGNHWVRLSTRATEEAHKERRAKIERTWEKRTYKTTAEKRAA